MVKGTGLPEEYSRLNTLVSNNTNVEIFYILFIRLSLNIQLNV